MVRWLSERGFDVVVFDNLSTGHREAVKWGELILGDLLEEQKLVEAFESGPIDAVMHFCARSLVGESVSDPYAYYRNNVSGTLVLLEVMRRYKVDKLIFSSTAAVFGQPQSGLIDESHPKAPINPYGASKLMVEHILAHAASAYGLRSVALRYFNAAGATTDATIGEAHVCETHLIPNILKSALSGGAPMRVFGDDYATPDGTCVRDYVHVEDLASAHELALRFVGENAGAHAFNLGNGQGFSVREVIDAASRVVGGNIEFEVVQRRDGDPDRLVASSQKARSLLGWAPAWTGLDDIIASAWRWHQQPRF